MRLWEAIAMFNNKPAGHAGYGRTKEEARRRGGTVMTLRIRQNREHSAQEFVDTLVRLGKLDADDETF